MAKRDDVLRQARATFEALASNNENERVGLALELQVGSATLRRVHNRVDEAWHGGGATRCAPRSEAARRGGECDLSFARRLVNVRRFAADYLLSAKNVDAIAEIPLE